MSPERGRESGFVIPVAETVSLPVEGTGDRFPVRRIYCVGQNYAAHVREMGGDERKPPFFFQKPRDAVVQNGSTVPYPPHTSDLHFEIELVLALGTGGTNIARDDAADHVYGLATGIDLTRRDLQSEAKKQGRPWDTSKGFDRSAPVSAILPLAGDPLPTAGRISLAVNGATRQDADLGEMVWECADIVAILSQYFELAPGDLVFTGTPAGVGPVQPGDRLVGHIDGLPDLQVAIGR
jgi:fumarylpyruvate hydrolase